MHWVPGAPRPSARGSPVRMLQTSPGDRLRGPRPAPAPSRPGWRKTTGAGPLPPLRQLPPPWLGGGPCAMIPVPPGLGGGGPELWPASAGRAPGPVQRARTAGHRPSPAVLSHLSSGFSGTEAGHSAAIARSPGKDDPSTVQPKATTRLGFSNELGSRPHGKSEFCFQVLPRLPLLLSPPPPWHIPGAPHLRAQLSGIPSLRPGGHRHCWGLGRICP